MFRCSQSSLENKKNRPREREHGIEMKNTRETEESGVEMMVARRKKRLITMAIGIRYTNIQINFPESILSCMAKQIKLKRATTTTTTNSLWTEIKWNANYANRWAHELTRARTKKKCTRHVIPMECSNLFCHSILFSTHFVVQLIFFIGHQRFGLLVIYTLYTLHTMFADRFGTPCYRIRWCRECLCEPMSIGISTYASCAYRNIFCWW